ncbi:hypothetical protein EKO27_g7164 [Xylaria grammica]|uniref:protein acetyllysine N-acetyltransferase n=1 Tax=Xylaria grammica TaxID=363999 RepID=A0A439D0H0_9PEZI|nr:hypothetical protein EKO27_g7164 [Xylaria grammica]
MGQDASTLVSEDTRPDTLEERSVAAVADFIKSGRANRIVVMAGAGISTAAGIPDFRSPKTGLYHNLARLNLPHPEAVFDIDFFRENPQPFYALAKELYPGNFHPTISHAFVALLAKKKLLCMLFTQISTVSSGPPAAVSTAKNPFPTPRCVSVSSRPPPQTVPARAVGGLVKPDIVFFGEQLPSRFFDNVTVPELADLVIVVGTSLTVHPFARLPRLARDRVPRLLLNMERVGDFGTRADDVLCLGACDDGIRELADELGWRDELEKMWVDLVGEKEAEQQRSRRKQEELDDELEELVQGVEQQLELSEDHDDHHSDAIANAVPQERKEGERPSPTPGTPPSEPADGAPLAAEEALPTRHPEGSIKEGKRDDDTTPATQDGAKKETFDI